jgi:nucleotide-binding universal stress UspA family protein
MYKRVLILVDSRPVSRSAVQEGTALAKVHGAEVLFFSVLPNYVFPVADMPMFTDFSITQFEREAKAAASRLLTGATVVAEKAGVVSRTASAGGEDAAKVVAEAARRRKCDVIVVASEGRNALLRLLTGSVIPGLITESPVPVLVCKQRASNRAEARATAPAPKARPARKKLAAAAGAAAAPKPARRRRVAV